MNSVPSASARRAGWRARSLALVLAAASLATVGLGSAAAAPSYPSSMASTGDSITRAFNTSWFPYIDNPAGSWSTGTTTSVASHYSRLLAANPAIAGRNYNDAKSGAKMADLAGQMQTVVSQHVGYVTALMGGNDLCTSSESTMTSVTDFTIQFTAAMDTITAGSPSTLVYVASLPNAYNLWSIFKNSWTARSVWALFKVCQSMLANPTSTARADVDRRARVLKREQDFNDTLASVCARYVQCRFDGYAVFNVAFTTADVTTRDYFHPSLAGQAKLAAATWTAGYWGQ